jgi:hypothetical protein
MSIIDDALSANATIANGYDPGRGGPHTEGGQPSRVPAPIQRVTPSS